MTASATYSRVGSSIRPSKVTLSTTSIEVSSGLAPARRGRRLTVVAFPGSRVVPLITFTVTSVGRLDP